MYVDNILVSVETVIEGSEFCSAAKTCLTDGGVIFKW